MYTRDAGQGAAWGATGAAEREFGRARRTATRARLGGKVRGRLSGAEPCCEGCCGSLRCFGEERAAVGAGRRSGGFETVEVEKVVGSVGRCLAFDAGFLPVCSCSQDRWKRVYGAFLEGKTLPPVELYKLGGSYFVVDGNHRVSVACYRGAAAVDAVVTEFA